MNIVDIGIDRLRTAPWNPNEMDEEMAARLRRSVDLFGFVVPLVVRENGDSHEVIGGNQRLSVIKEAGHQKAPCVVVEADDAQAWLLSQALNHIAGEDDLGLRAELIRRLLEEMDQEHVFEVLPETADSLQELASLGQEEMAKQLGAWQKAQQAKLSHMTFQLTSGQKGIVDRAIESALPITEDHDGPNRKGTALTAICKAYQDTQEDAS